MSAPSKRQHILDAACRIVKELGAVHLTLDAVAKEARVSKGGLLYHFPSKEALIQEMITHMDEKYLKNVEALSRQDKESRGNWSRAYAIETFNQVEGDKDIFPALLAGIATSPDSLEPLKQTYGHLRKRLEDDGIDPLKSNLIRLASDGLWFSELFGLDPLEPYMRSKVLEELIRLSKEN
ncbi:TetR/AcrR family transcriptional regulator [Paenibacillus larvae]|uniref:TetR/AcrR family transcriptional regulator n=1 Tax=Paenibacillus larvae TaxID=1464 RepID=A0AAP5N3U8_9BACL|nr:TetR/AcrR family transcriptional regulator [Paenibacillus larvae]AQR77011.1 TetR family transcriptional regulator [Paenibacillus larvae subsp. larvae]AVF22062.1 transcriptional regulator, TetR family [Paenibacillus larvae subsp. larvae]ETK27106.1 transcriptional regulator, TetR family [Paenibacillus larvae subsp. larvae DSM 25719]MCY7478253.1 TetR/AcrR family transcriptional regulator [Paenibacillus larvae]MCY7489370.1 TetR/AcrR family transcriptional regulator [Paenibacillus larvae]